MTHLRLPALLLVLLFSTSAFAERDSGGGIDHGGGGPEWLVSSRVLNERAKDGIDHGGGGVQWLVSDRAPKDATNDVDEDGTALSQPETCSGQQSERSNDCQDRL